MFAAYFPVVTLPAVWRDVRHAWPVLWVSARSRAADDSAVCTPSCSPCLRLSATRAASSCTLSETLSSAAPGGEDVPFRDHAKGHRLAHAAGAFRARSTVRWGGCWRPGSCCAGLGELAVMTGRAPKSGLFGCPWPPLRSFYNSPHLWLVIRGRRLRHAERGGIAPHGG